MVSVNIISNIEIAPSVYVLAFPRIFDFLPGQVVNIDLNNTPRMYSIASGMKENVIKLLYDIKPLGKLTPLLKNLKKGDNIKISQPFGNFLCDPGTAYWIASGTGIAPFYSMFRSGIGFDKILIHGGRTPESFYFRDELIKFFKKENYICCCPKTNVEGLVPKHLKEYLKEQNKLSTTEKYYLCGSPEMVVDVRDILIAKQVPFNNIISEIYF
jgi:ferredoxin--NADP+ reductase